VLTNAERVQQEIAWSVTQAAVQYAFKLPYVEYELGSNANNGKQAPAECRSFGVEFQ